MGEIEQRFRPCGEEFHSFYKNPVILAYCYLNPGPHMQAHHVRLAILIEVVALHVHETDLSNKSETQLRAEIFHRLSDQ